MKRRMIGFCLTVMLLAGALTPAALASAEPETEQTPETVLAEKAQEASAEEVLTEDVLTEETPAEEVGFDPDDPMYEKMMEIMTLSRDGASGQTYSDFTPRSVAGEEVVKGIDVSAWQGSINWKSVAASGVKFVIIRAAYRGSSSGTLAEDSMFTQYIAGAKAAGLQVGVYIFSQAITAAEGREEARYLMSLVSGYEIDMPLVIDYEYYGTSGRLYEANLSRQAATDVCTAFCAEIEKNGYDAMVYANPYMLNNKLYPASFSSVWLAHYTAQTTYSGDYDIWQCSGTGTVSGISGDVDLDFWFKPTALADPFTDVSSGDWYYDSVMEAYNRGIVNGMNGSTFAPASNATRGQVVTMLYRVEGEPAVSGTTAFTDLTQDYYKNAVLWASGNNITNGVSETAFNPEGLITREDLVTMLYRLAQSPAVTGGLSAYSDAASVKDYAVNAMLWAVKNGIINGYEDNTLRPLIRATRAEVCAILIRYDALSA